MDFDECGANNSGVQRSTHNHGASHQSIGSDSSSNQYE